MGYRRWFDVKKMSLLIIILLLMAACNPTEPSEETKVKEPSLEEPQPDPNEQPKENNETEKEEDGGSDFEQNQPEGESPKAQPKSEEEITGKIITLWYLGSWNGNYISASSYKEGLVWKVMGSHPPGAKQPGFKSWNTQPFNT